jgi:hypothetical protein
MNVVDTKNCSLRSRQLDMMVKEMGMDRITCTAFYVLKNAGTGMREG